MSQRVHKWLALRVLLLAAALTVIAFATLTPTPGATTAVPVVWCLGCISDWLADAVSNLVLFMPLGVALALLGVRTSRALAIGAIVSLLIELLQYSGHPLGRTPSLSDLLTNSSGTLVAAWTVIHWQWWLVPTPVVARRLAAFWMVVLCGMLVATSWALSSPLAPMPLPAAVVPSLLPYTPGYGWYAAEADSATVNGIDVPHRGTGPVIAMMARTETVRLRVVVRGRDSRTGVVPVLFVHARGSVDPHTMLAQRGDDAIVRVLLNAGAAGFAQPDLTLRGAFAGQQVKLEGMSSHGYLQLTRLDADGTGAPRDAELSLTPALGWTLLQTVVRIDSGLGVAMTVVWLLAWCLPLGYWIARASGRGVVGEIPFAFRRPLSWLLLASAVVVVVAYAGAEAFDIQPLLMRQVVTVLAGAIAGAVIAGAVIAGALVQGYLPECSPKSSTDSISR